MPAPQPPMCRRLAIITVLASAVGVLSLLAAAWLVRDAVRGIAINDGISDEAHSAQLAAETLLSTLKDAETGQRGYLLTDDAAYLVPYQTARARLRQDFDSLDAAPFGNPDRTARIASLGQLGTAKLAELGQTIALWQSGHQQDALALVRTNEGQRIMDTIRADIAALQQDVQNRMDDARRRMASPLVWTEIAALLALASALLGGVILLQGRARRVVTAGFDALRTSLQELEAARQQQQQTTTLLTTILETAPGLIYAKNRDGSMLLANGATLDLIGKPWAEVTGRTDRQFLPDVDQGEAVMANDRRIMDTGVAEAVEELVRTDRAERTWLSTKTPLRAADGQVVGIVGVSVEITERKRVEARLREMVNELNHRVRNTLATVQSIASQTLRGSHPAVRFKLEARLLALAAAHDVLTQENWSGARLDEVIAKVLTLHGGIAASQVLTDGPTLRLKPSSAVALALGMHELATNALCYGALSSPAGTVTITWAILPGEVPTVRLTWRERGGPAVVTPASRGFGLRLIERSMAADLAGRADLRFDPTGLVCEILAPLAEIAASAEIKPFLCVGSI